MFHKRRIPWILASIVVGFLIARYCERTFEIATVWPPAFVTRWNRIASMGAWPGLIAVLPAWIIFDDGPAPEIVGRIVELARIGVDVIVWSLTVYLPVSKILTMVERSRQTG
jgi:hypothetical protein